MKKMLYASMMLFYSVIVHAHPIIKQQEAVYLYSKQESKYQTFLIHALDAYGVQYSKGSTLDSKSSHIHIILDAHELQQSDLPKHYIVYQNQDITGSGISAHYNNILKNAITVWDYSLQNIARYSRTTKHYYYLPPDFAYIDPVILSCFLPTNALSLYKELVQYSNAVNNEITSHLPTLFCYTVNQSPQRMLELGIGNDGFSNKAFSRAARLHNTHMTGVDIVPGPRRIYNNLPNAIFHQTDDIPFLKAYAQNPNNPFFDLIFIDTSHEYAHTIAEIEASIPLLKPDGIMLFHDSNVHPLNNNTAYLCLNQTIGQARGNPRGVSDALKEYFYDFDEYSYCDISFTKNGINWRLVHYPFCNGLTILKRQ